MNYFRILLEEACGAIQESFGSIDLIKTAGVNILKSEGQDWIDFGASNLQEMCIRANEIRSMLINYNNYDDTKKQFMPDVLAILDDLAYHASIFNIYYNSALRSMSVNSGKIQSIFHEKLKYDLFDVEKDKITNDWEFNLSETRKKEFIFNLYKLSSLLCFFCSDINNLSHEAFTLIDKMHYVSAKLIFLSKDIYFTES